MEEPHQFGIIGLGRIGSGFALQGVSQGMHVVGYDPAGVPPGLLQVGIDLIDKPQQFNQRLESPRTIFLAVPAGKAIDQILAQLTPILEADDIVIDGGNSYWGDSVRRYYRCRDEYGIHFVDCGTSGGPRGARRGASFMVGATPALYERVEPLLRRLARPDGVVHCGGPGTGHYVKLVHNGIEFGILQALGEGVQLLESFREKLPVEEILYNWSRGSVIRSWLLELLAAEYHGEENLKDLPDHIEDTGEVNWLVEDAMRMEVPIPVITQSVMQLFASRDTSAAWARVVAMVRRGLDEHAYGMSPVVPRRARSASRVGPWLEEFSPPEDEGRLPH